MLNFIKLGSGAVKPMPVAEIITIGTELLLGDIQDTNTSFLARSLRDMGVDVYRTTCVGDNSQRIEAIIREALGRSDIVLTTGGLGPTVDDPTRQAVANALGVELVVPPGALAADRKDHVPLRPQSQREQSPPGLDPGRGGSDPQSGRNRTGIHLPPGWAGGHLPAGRPP